jgi:hypothetical protein
MKKQLLLLTCLASYAFATARTVHEDHIPALIKIGVSYLLHPNDTWGTYSPMSTSEANDMRNKITSEVQADINKCKQQGWSYDPYNSSAKTYDLKRFFQVAQDAIIAHIKAAAERASYNHLGTVHEIEKEVREKLEQAKRDYNNGNFNPGALKIYADYLTFQSHVREIKQRLSTQPKPAPAPAPKPTQQFAQAPKLYNDNPDCPICLEEYKQVIRINIHPCGHNMCEGCAKRYMKESSSTCSICRQWYDKARLEHDLAKSAAARKNNC